MTAEFDHDLVDGAPVARFIEQLDGDTVIDGGALAFLGVLPSRREVVDAVRTRLSESGNSS